MSYYLTVLKKYAVFTGRARRAEIWYFILFNFIVSVVLQMLFGSVAETAEDGAASPLAFLPVLYTLVILLPSLAVAIRRLHDTGRSGWWILIALIPLVGTIVLIVFYVQDGDAGDNAYGTNPKAAQMA
ncbi:MAG: DUF805 domain-containing protein [Pirellulales bacterium]|jgi:uncharacterized membrane protein YhaH (DUF805 family)|nr:DUF805 domain-containing protein [Pirellulales bacterium]